MFWIGNVKKSYAEWGSGSFPVVSKQSVTHGPLKCDLVPWEDNEFPVEWSGDSFNLENHQAPWDWSGDSFAIHQRPFPDRK